MCLQGRPLLQHTCFYYLPVFCFIFPQIFYKPEISPSQFFFQIVTIIPKKISSFSRCYKWKSGFRMTDGNRQKQNTFYWYIMNMK